MTREEMTNYITKLRQTMSIEDMKYEIAEYWECGGYADFYNVKLKNLNEDQTIEAYINTFSDDENSDAYMEWHREYMGKKINEFE